MWSDKETSEDLLGYTVHSSLLKSVITNEKNLPITVGLYGDWGLGKSSILKILEKQLEEERQKNEDKKNTGGCATGINGCSGSNGSGTGAGVDSTLTLTLLSLTTFMGVVYAKRMRTKKE